MIVYHGSVMPVKNPAVALSKDFLDFGKGFYVTSFKEQAEKWAKRKALRKNSSAVVSVYNLDLDDTIAAILTFDNFDEKWLDFVCACRRGEDSYKNYDVIIGNVANDDVFKTVDLYFRGIWSKERALDELRYYKINDQICFVSQSVLDSLLTFEYSYEVR